MAKGFRILSFAVSTEMNQNDRVRRQKQAVVLVESCLLSQEEKGKNSRGSEQPKFQLFYGPSSKVYVQKLKQ